MAHDRWFYFLASVFGQVCNIRSPLAAYRQHDNNVFGWREHGGWRRRLSSLLANRGELYRKYALAAESRALILDTCRERLDGSWLRQAVVAAELYGKIARSLERRHALYATHHLSGRLQTFGTLVAEGDYGGQWGLGRKSLVKDFLVGIMLGPSNLIQLSS